MIKNITLVVLFIVTFLGCSKDDICSEDTPTTPLLIITFNDIANPTERKTVPGLLVRTIDENQTVVISTSSDSIALPLHTGFDTIEYAFILNSGDANELIDAYAFEYTREDIYVNRACAFKTIFTNLTTSETDTGTTDWILNYTINNQIVENETSAHLTFYH